MPVPWLHEAATHSRHGRSQEWSIYRLSTPYVPWHRLHHRRLPVAEAPALSADLRARMPINIYIPMLMISVIPCNFRQRCAHGNIGVPILHNYPIHKTNNHQTAIFLGSKTAHKSSRLTYLQPQMEIATEDHVSVWSFPPLPDAGITKPR